MSWRGFLRSCLKVAETFTLPFAFGWQQPTPYEQRLEFMRRQQAIQMRSVAMAGGANLAEWAEFPWVPVYDDRARAALIYAVEAEAAAYRPYVLPSPKHAEAFIQLRRRLDAGC